MIKKMELGDFRPQASIEKINEIIEKVNALELAINEHTHTVEVAVSKAFLDNA